MVIDGEILDFKCKECGFKFKHIIGYGPICPNPWLRHEMLKKNPPQCPKCRSFNVRQTILRKILHP